MPLFGAAIGVRLLRSQQTDGCRIRVQFPTAPFALTLIEGCNNPIRASQSFKLGSVALTVEIPDVTCALTEKAYILAQW
ncbi:hypothetical protein [Nostoc sp. LEGE 12450]|uniref:hypothetical protein n=1 Tax=Nostoc sp. LEGE 12450 TaxID=1828643 RepID=UPI001881A2E8|nr:hypothetical protein [Nostoc sp. LEGE 12450]MBE8987148.1 hypothetical protein [Nostoc sp. LEGE 12450]